MYALDSFSHQQSLSLIAVKPKYTSAVAREQFQAPLELQNMYLFEELPDEAHQDHIFLYIRPHTQGRGERAPGLVGVATY